MSEASNKYYYRDIEESSNRLANLLRELNVYLDSVAVNELIDLLSDIPWHRLSAKYSDTKKRISAMIKRKKLLWGGKIGKKNSRIGELQ